MRAYRRVRFARARGLRTLRKSAICKLGALGASYRFLLGGVGHPLRWETIAGHEIKTDGYRAQLHIRDGKIAVYSRSGYNWSDEFAPIAQAANMTMVFKAQDPAMLKSVKVGDKVKFEADRVNGQFTVTKIQKSK
jgi:hypothetical protein